MTPICAGKKGYIHKYVQSLVVGRMMDNFPSLLNKHSSSPGGLRSAVRLTFKPPLHHFRWDHQLSVTSYAAVSSAGKERVAAWNSEHGGQERSFPGVLKRQRPASPPPRILVACEVLPGSRGRSTASEWNVPSRFKVQSPEGPRDHLRPPTCSFFFNSPSSADLYCWQRISQIHAAKSFPLAL